MRLPCQKSEERVCHARTNASRENGVLERKKRGGKGKKRSMKRWVGICLADPGNTGFL